MSQTTKIHIKGILAMDKDEGIGKDGEMPWHIPKDFKHFKNYTQGNVCVMGRKTFEDIVSYKKELKGDVLPNRHCVVLTSNPEDYYTEFPLLTRVFFHKVPSLNAFQNILETGFLGFRICIVGGVSIFNHFAGRYDELSITKIDESFNCDRFVSEDNLTQGMELRQSTPIHDDNYKVRLSVWRRA